MEREIKNPADRLPDNLTQFPGVTDDFQRKQLVIGFDFGTAFTKVIIGEDRVRYAVPWKKISDPENQYLLPGRFYLQKDGACDLEENSGQMISGIKMRLLDRDFGNIALLNTCIFAALVLRKTRTFLLENHSSIYGSNHIDWLINIGLPTDDIHDEELANVYKKVFAAAWRASTQPGTITSEKCEAALSHVKTEDSYSISWNKITTFAEFAAQITGYVRSPLREKDLHLLIDVGAGTVDTTVFNVHDVDGEDVFPIFSKAVENLGTRFLIKNRIKNTDVAEDGELGPFAPVPSLVRFSSLLGIKKSEFEKIDTNFREKLKIMISGSLHYTKSRRYPLSQTWARGVPVFLCGGGAKCDFYADALKDAEELSGLRFIQKELPFPSDLVAEGIGPHEFHRMSVAFGLSFEPFDIGEMIRFEDVDDIETGEPGHEGRSRGICRRCNGDGGLHFPCGSCGGSGWV